MVRDWCARTMASIRVSDLSIELSLEHTLTLCFEARVCEIVRFAPGFTNLELRFLEVFPLFILLFCTRSHSSSRGLPPCSLDLSINRDLEPSSKANKFASLAYWRF